MPDKFDFIKRLGSGHFGEVWYAKDTHLDFYCAVKCIPQDKIYHKNNFFHEAQILKANQHTNIIQVNEADYLPDGRIYLSMEYCKKGSLEAEASGAYVPLSRAKKLMIDILRGLEHMHALGVIHRDIKPANILISDSFDGKLADFGLALPLNNKSNPTFVEFYDYILHMAPEIRSIQDYTCLSDLYACGVTLYRLVNGDIYLKTPFIMDLKKEIRAGKFPNRSSYRRFIPRALRMLINKAMSVNQSKRFQTAAEMRHALEQVRVDINWNENKVNNGCRWSGTTNVKNNHCYLVELEKNNSDNKWCVTLKKGKSKRNLKRINDLCFKDLSKAVAEKKVNFILQNYVSGKLK